MEVHIAPYMHGNNMRIIIINDITLFTW